MATNTSSSLYWGQTPTRESLADIRAKRDRFLADPREDLAGVRDVIARSWTRSAACRVDPDRIYSGVRDVQMDATFMRVALPVVERLGDMARDTGACVILSDALGTHAIMRGDREVIRWADARLATVGGHMPEDLAGTNSDGTALEEGRSVQVWGPEHYAVALQDTFCTSVPIRDALRGRIGAVLTLMVPERVALTTDPASLALIVEGAAAEITRLAADRLAHRERALLQAYMREARTRGAEAVLAIDGRTTIASAKAQQLLTPDDFAVVAGYANEATTSGSVLDCVVALGGSSAMRLTAKPVVDDGDVVGAVVRFREHAQSEKLLQFHAIPVDVPLRGLVGDSVVMSKVRLAALSLVAQDSVVYLTGERGTGRAHLAKLMAQEIGQEPVLIECDKTRRIVVARSILDELRDAVLLDRPIVATHIDQVDPTEATHIYGYLRDAATRVRVFVTAAHVSGEALETWMSNSVQEVRLPPLRSRRDDIPKLVAHFLEGESREGPLTASQDLVAALVKAAWPGNVSELRDVVLSAAAVATTEVGLEHVGELHRKAIAHGRLTRLEAAELEQIRHALIEARGNRARASQLLEIGRSTLYRKIDLYERRGFDLGT